MLLDGLLLKGIDLGCLGCSSCGGDIFREGFNRRQCAARKEDVCPVARKGTRDRTADMSSCPIDDGAFALEKHRSSFRVQV
jgi:hypothetical protein